jgi:hypothetical protein
VIGQTFVARRMGNPRRPTSPFVCMGKIRANKMGGICHWFVANHSKALVLESMYALKLTFALDALEEQEILGLGRQNYRNEVKTVPSLFLS